MIYLALDQALNTSGWAIFDNLVLEKYGTFSTKSSAPIDQRLEQIEEELEKLYETYEFEYIFLEDIQKQQNAETYKKLAYAQAVILIWCSRTDIPYTILSPSHWRSVLKDKDKISFGKTRTEQKKAAQQLVKQQYDISVTQDEADAICIGMAGYSEYQKNQSAF